MHVPSLLQQPRAMPGIKRAKTKESSAEGPSKIARPLAKVLNGSLVKSRTGKKYIGAHVPIAGGVFNAFANNESINGKAFALFLRNQRQWNAKPLSEDIIEKFVEAKKNSPVADHLIIPHGSYLLNLGSPKDDVREKSLALFVDELQRCEKLGIHLYNFHPGSTCGTISVEKCIGLIAKAINHGMNKTEKVKIVLENMSRQGNTIGGDFKELKKIIDLVKDKSRIGVCIDTCHAMAAGYDLSKQEGFDQMITDLGNEIGFKYLMAMHLNDSKGEAGCRLDRHENIGKGKIGIEGFRRVMNCPHFNDIPLILETPYDKLEDQAGKEIKILEGLIDE